MLLQKIVIWLRLFRKWHRYTGLVLVAFLSLVAITGLLLGWKKHVDLLQPPAQRPAVVAPLTLWQSLDSIAVVAINALDTVENVKGVIKKIDVRPDEGIAKVIFESGYWEVQVNGETAKPQSIRRRHSDWIEQIHDGSIFGSISKLLYTSSAGIGLLLLSFTGFSFWYGSKIIREKKTLKN